MFLAFEDERTVLNVASLAMLDGTRADGSQLSRDDIVALVEQRLHLLPPLRWSLAPVPFGIGHPSWVDGDVDLDFHVRELSLPAPGDDARLEAQVARLAAHPLDRSRPLWELYLIHGLSDGRVALLTKLHHAIVDGMSGAEIMSILFDTTPEGRRIAPAPPHRAERRPGQTTVLVRGAGSVVQQSLEAVPAAGRSIANLDKNIFVRAFPGSVQVSRFTRRAQVWRPKDEAILEDAGAVAPSTRFNARISRRRSYNMVSLPMGPVREIKTAKQATVNDVLVAISAGALRSWMFAHGDLPAEPLIAAIPVSIRNANRQGAFGNEVGVMTVELPTDEPDPLARLIRGRDAMRGAKERHQAVPASLMRDATDLIRP
jgi:diacylglycerol O-acyltransferase / wax synthase